jgi:hypothetical protein
MNESHPFWGVHSPLAALAGGGLVIMASCRLAFALTIFGALVWVYVLSALTASAACPVFPVKGKKIVLLFLSSFTGSIYLLVIFFVSPMLALQVFFMVSLVPLVCAGSGVFDRTNDMDGGDAAAAAFSESAVLGLVIAALSLIREPLGFLSLSLPGGTAGFVRIFVLPGGNFFPVGIISSSAGALILLGYAVSIYRRANSREEKQ